MPAAGSRFAHARKTRSLCSRLLLARLSRRFLRHRSPPLSRSPSRFRPRLTRRMSRPVPPLRQYQRDMRNAALIAESSSLRRGTNALHARTVVGDGALDVQIVKLDIQIFLGAEKVRV